MIIEKVTDQFIMVDLPADLKAKQQIKQKNKGRKIMDSLKSEFERKKQRIEDGQEKADSDHGVHTRTQLDSERPPLNQRVETAMDRIREKINKKVGKSMTELE